MRNSWVFPIVILAVAVIITVIREHLISKLEMGDTRAGTLYDFLFYCAGGAIPGVVLARKRRRVAIALVVLAATVGALGLLD